MTASGTVAQCFKFRENMRDAADSAQRNFPEGFGRFAPGDFARFLDHSRASLMEVKNALSSGVERAYWTSEEADAADKLANRALKALSGLQRYLRSPDAKRNAEQARARHIAQRRASRPGQQLRIRKPTNLTNRDEPDEPADRNAPDEPANLTNPTNPQRTRRTRRPGRTPTNHDEPRVNTAARLPRADIARR